jgi:hypothetical protein
MPTVYKNEITNEPFPYEERWAEVQKAYRRIQLSMKIEDSLFSRGCWHESYGYHYTREYRHREQITQAHIQHHAVLWDAFWRDLEANKVIAHTWSYPPGHNDVVESVTRLY